MTDVALEVAKELEQELELTHNQIKAVNRQDKVLGYAVFDDPGVGKTRIGIESVNRYALRDNINTALVVVPAQCRSVWDDRLTSQLIKYMRHPFTVESYVGDHLESAWSHGDTVNEPSLTFVVISYESIRRHNGFAVIYDRLKRVRHQYWALLDESHKFKSRNSSHFRAIYAITKYARRITLFSGSPCDHSNSELWCQMQVVNHVNGNVQIHKETYREFRARYCSHENLPQGTDAEKDEYDHAAERSAEFLAQTYGDFMQSTRIEDVWQLPEQTHTTIDVPLLPQTWETYRKAIDDLVLDIKTDEHPDGVVINNSIVALTKAAAICAGHLQHKNVTKPNSFEKVYAALQWLKAQEHPDSFILWTRFRHEAELLQSFIRMQSQRGALPPCQVYAIVGAQTPKQRRSIVRSMLGAHARKSDDSVICVANIGAGQHGIDLTAAAHVLYLSLDFSVTRYRQTLARTMRKGQERDTSYTYLLATPPPGTKLKKGDEHGTVDQLIYDVVTRRVDVQSMSREVLAQVIDGLR